MNAQFSTLFLSLIIISTINADQPVTSESPQKEKNTRLFEAAKDNNCPQIEKAIVGKAKVDAKDNYGQTPLMMAASSGNAQAVETLLKKKADKDARDRRGQTALFLAAKNGHTKVVDLLLQNNANTEIKDKNRQTTLMAAAAAGYIEIVKLLLDAKASPTAKNKIGQTALDLAQSPEMRRLLQEYMSGPRQPGGQMACDVPEPVGISRYPASAVRPRTWSEKSDEDQDLLRAAAKGDLYGVQQALLNGADIETLDRKNYSTPLLVASYAGHALIVEFLLNEGADLYALNKHYDSALMYACCKGHATTVAVLLGWAEKQDAKDDREFIDQQNDQGLTGLMYAARKNYVLIVDLLLKHRASLFLRNDRDQTALDMAPLRSPTKQLLQEYRS